jgi:hypothetical protein
MQELSFQILISAGRPVWWNTHPNVIDIVIIPIIVLMHRVHNTKRIKMLYQTERTACLQGTANLALMMHAHLWTSDQQFA